MKIKLHIVLYESGKPKFQKETEFEITSENLTFIISGSILFGEKPNVHVLAFKGLDFDSITNTLHARSEVLHKACNGYVRDLLADGWTEI